MRTPWSNLLKYGIGFATVVVGTVAGLIVLSVIGLVVLIAKLLVFIK